MRSWAFWVIVFLMLAGCETAHKWDGERAVRVCMFYCIEYTEDATSHRTGAATNPGATSGN